MYIRQYIYIHYMYLHHVPCVHFIHIFFEFRQVELFFVVWTEQLLANIAQLDRCGKLIHHEKHQSAASFALRSGQQVWIDGAPLDAPPVRRAQLVI